MKRASQKSILKVAGIMAVMLIFALLLSSCAGGSAGTQPSTQETATQVPDTEAKAKTVEDTEVVKSPETTISTGPVKVVDGMGTEINLDNPAQKIIVFVPSALEIIAALDALDKVIGVDNWSLENGEPLAQKFEGFGDFQSLNMEKITAADPDIIIGLVGWAEADVQKLTDLGVRIYIVDANTMDEVYTEIENMGALVGKQQEASALKEMVQKGVEEVTSKTAALSDSEKPKVFYEVWNDPLMSAGNNTFINQLIEMAGGKNIVAKDGLEGWPEYSMEKLIQNNPDIMIAPTSMATDAGVILSDTKLSKINAVINKKVYIIPDNPISRPSQNIVKGLYMLAQAIHPEIFGAYGSGK